LLNKYIGEHISIMKRSFSIFWQFYLFKTYIVIRSNEMLKVFVFIFLELCVALNKNE